MSVRLALKMSQSSSVPTESIIISKTEKRYDEIRVLLELPLSVVQRAHVTRLEPAGDAMEVECVLYTCK